MERTLKEYHFPRFLHIVAAISLVIMLGLSILSWLAYALDGMNLALYLLPLWLCMATYWVATLATLPKQVTFRPTHLVITPLVRLPWWSPIEVAYADIHAVRTTLLGLHIYSTHRRILLSNFQPNFCATIEGELELRVPRLQAVVQQRFATLPIVLPAERFAPIFSLAFGLLLLFIAVGIVYQCVVAVPSSTLTDWALVIGLGVVCLALGGGLCYGVLCHTIWRYTFTPTAIHARYSLWTKEWAASDIRAITLVGEEQIHRGMKRTHWQLVVDFASAPKLSVSRSQWSVPFDSSEVAEERWLRHLETRLQALYSLSDALSDSLPPSSWPASATSTASSRL